MRSESYDQILARWRREVDANRWSGVRMLAVFVAVFLASLFAWEACRGTVVERLLIDTATVRPASWLIQLAWPEFGVRAQANSIVWPAGRINVLNGCEGLDLVFLLAAAFAAYPMPGKQRLLGMGLGVVLAYLANQGRLVVLWYAYAQDREAFAPLHGTVAPLILVALCLLYFMLFIGRDAVRRH